MTYQVYEDSYRVPKDRWVATVYGPYNSTMRCFPTETEARNWAEKEVNLLSGVSSTARGDPALKMEDDGWAAYKPPVVEDIKIEVTCYCCGKPAQKSSTVPFTYADTVHLETQCCGRKEFKSFSLAKAKEIAKVGWVAFLS